MPHWSRVLRLCLAVWLMLLSPGCKSSSAQLQAAKVPAPPAAKTECKANGGKGNWCHFICIGANGWCTFDGDGSKREQFCSVPKGVTSTTCAEGGTTEKMPATASAPAPAANANGSTEQQAAGAGTACADCKDCGDKCCSKPGPWYACDGWWCAKDDNGSGKACVVQKMGASGKAVSATGEAICKDCKACGTNCCHDPGPWYECNGWWCANEDKGSGSECVVKIKD